MHQSHTLVVQPERYHLPFTCCHRACWEPGALLRRQFGNKVIDETREKIAWAPVRSSSELPEKS